MDVEILRKMMSVPSWVYFVACPAGENREMYVVAKALDTNGYSHTLKLVTNYFFLPKGAGMGRLNAALKKNFIPGVDQWINEEIKSLQEKGFSFKEYPKDIWNVVD